MNNKATYVLVGVGVLGMTAVGASAYTGRAVTGRLSEHTARIAKLMPELQVEEQIEPGVFHTSRQLKVRLGCLPVPAKDGNGVERSAPIDVYWRDTIHHVPFVSSGGKVASIDSELVVASADVERLFGTRTPLTVHTNIVSDEKFEADAKLVPIKLAPKPGDELDFSGLIMHVTGSFPDAAGTFAYTGKTEPIQLRGKAEDGSFSATIGPMQLSGNMLIDPAATSIFLPNHSAMSVADLTAQVIGPAQEAPVNIALHGVTAKMDTTVTNDLLTGTTHMQSSFKTDDFAIDKLEMGSTMRNLHVPTLTKLTRASMRHSFSCEAPPSPEALLEQLTELGKSALELLPYAPEYKVGPIAIELGGKRAELSYTLGVHGVAQGSSPELMELATKYGYANADAKLDLGLLDQLASGQQQQQGGPALAAMMARGMLESFVQEGFLAREGDTVHGRVEFDAGALKLNGQPFQLPEFEGMDLDAVKRSLEGGDPEPEPEPEAAP